MTGLEESGVLQAAREEYQQYMTLQHSCSKDEKTLCDRCMQPINARIIEQLFWDVVSLPATQSRHPVCLFLGLTAAQWAAFHCTGWLSASEGFLFWNMPA